MDRYHRVEKPRPESAINENEIRVTTQGLIRNYLTYASTLLLFAVLRILNSRAKQALEISREKRAKEIVFKAMGQAINKTVAIAEILKKRIPGLHQDTAISSTSITDVWEPIEEGLVPLEMTRHVSMISITLSTRELNKNSAGYQAPLHVEQRKQQYRLQQPQQYQQQQHQPKQAQNQVGDDSHGRGRGRGRARGWGRGGYGGYGGGYGGYGGYGNNQENGGWNSYYGRGGGRGRGGWGYRGAGYERGRGGGGRGYGRGRGRMGARGRGYQGE